MSAVDGEGADVGGLELCYKGGSRGVAFVGGGGGVFVAKWVLLVKAPRTDAGMRSVGGALRTIRPALSRLCDRATMASIKFVMCA